MTTTGGRVYNMTLRRFSFWSIKVSNLTPCNEEFQMPEVIKLPEPECIHRMRFDHAAHYGHFDIYKCQICDHTELIYWNSK